jgi:hypothetical protein
VTKVEDVYEVVLPPKVQQLLGLFRVTVDLGMDSITSVLTCLDLDGFETQLAFWMLLPPILIGGILAGTVVRLFCGRGYSHRALVQLSAHPMLVVTFMLYPQIANVAFKAFSCHASLDGHRYLMADVAIDCDSHYYQEHVSKLASTAIAIYVFGVFGAVSALLFCARHAIVRQTPTLLSSSLAFLCHGYEPWAYWWGSALYGVQLRSPSLFEPQLMPIALCAPTYDGAAELAEMLRRVTLVGFFVLFQPRGSVVQLIAGTTFSAIFLVRAGNLKWCRAHGMHFVTPVRISRLVSSYRCKRAHTWSYLRITSPTAAVRVFCVEPMQQGRPSARSK